MHKALQQLGVGTIELSAQEKAYVNQVLNSNRLSYGPFCKKFEAGFAKLHQSRFAVFVNSGTSALSIAVATLKEALGWNAGDEVLVPAVTFVATANVVLEHNLRPVFVDVDARTYNIDPVKIEAAITPRTRCIIPVHLFGLVSDMDPIMAIARRHALAVVEDSCETIGVAYKGKMAGSFGDISCFSTYIAHLLVTGVGGFAVTSDPRYAEILRSVANHGRDNVYISIDDDKVEGAALAHVVGNRFRFLRPGRSYRATEMEAAVGLGQMERIDEILTGRRANAAWLNRALAPFAHWLQLPWYDRSVQEHSFMMYPIVIKKGAPFTKQELVTYLEQWNVETRDMMPLINQPVYAWMKIDQSRYPVADWINTHGFYIGCHQGLKEDDLRYIGGVFGEFFGKRGE